MFLPACLFICIMTLPDPVLYDDKITIINIAMNEGEDDVVYNDVMNVEVNVNNQVFYWLKLFAN